MISPQRDDDEAWLAQMWERAREWERRTFSNMTVTSGTVHLFEVSPLPPPNQDKSLVAVRDYTGNTLLQNDTNAGWGLAAPLSTYPAYPRGPRLSGTETAFTARWEFQGYLQTASFEWGYVHGVDAAGTTSEARIEYQVGADPTVYVVTNSTTTSNEDVTNTATVFTVRSGTFTFPADYFGQFCKIWFKQRKASGAGTTTYLSPVYLNAV